MISISEAFPSCSVRLVAGDDPDGGELYCVTRSAGDAVWIEAPARRLNSPPPDVGAKVLLDSLQPEAVFRMPAEIQEVKSGDWVTIVCRRAGPIQRIQRRRRQRALIRMPVRLEREAGDEIETHTEDINSLGMRVLSRAPLSPAEVVRFSLDLQQDNESIEGEAIVIRCRRIGPDWHDVGLRFQWTDNRLAEHLADVLMHKLLPF